MEISRHEKLINEAKNGYEKYKGLFKVLQDSYLLDYGDKKRQRAKELNKAELYVPKLNAKVKYLIAALNNVYFASERIADLEYYMNSNEKPISIWQEAIDFYTERLNLFTTLQLFFYGRHAFRYSRCQNQLG